MSYNFVKSLDLCGLRFPKIIQYNNNLLLFAGTQIAECGTIKKYGTTYYAIDNNFTINNNTKKILNFDSIVKNSFSDLYISYWLRDINIDEDSSLTMMIEFKYNNNNKSYTHKTYVLKTNDLENFKIVKQYNYDNYFIFKEINKIILSSRIQNNSDFFWGTYLFEFIKEDNIKYTPIFDNIINYDNDGGHVLHNVKYLERLDIYEILFSIRHKISDINDYIYKIYTAKTKDFINFTETNEVEIQKFEKQPLWFSYPSLFLYNNQEFMICNQDEFGKSKSPLIFTRPLNN